MLPMLASSHLLRPRPLRSSQGGPNHRSQRESADGEQLVGGGLMWCEDPRNVTHHECYRGCVEGNSQQLSPASRVFDGPEQHALKVPYTFARFHPASAFDPLRTLARQGGWLVLRRRRSTWISEIGWPGCTQQPINLAIEGVTLLVSHPPIRLLIGREDTRAA